MTMVLMKYKNVYSPLNIYDNNLGDEILYSYDSQLLRAFQAKNRGVLLGGMENLRGHYSPSSDIIFEQVSLLVGQ